MKIVVTTLTILTMLTTSAWAQSKFNQPEDECSRGLAEFERTSTQSLAKIKRLLAEPVSQEQQCELAKANVERYPNIRKFDKACGDGKPKAPTKYDLAQIEEEKHYINEVRRLCK